MVLISDRLIGIQMSFQVIGKLFFYRVKSVKPGVDSIHNVDETTAPRQSIAPSTREKPIFGPITEEQTHQKREDDEKAEEQRILRQKAGKHSHTLYDFTTEHPIIQKCVSYLFIALTICIVLAAPTGFSCLMFRAVINGIRTLKTAITARIRIPCPPRLKHVRLTGQSSNITLVGDIEDTGSDKSWTSYYSPKESPTPLNGKKRAANLILVAVEGTGGELDPDDID
jgi:hypothetical protein